MGAACSFCGGRTDQEVLPGQKEVLCSGCKELRENLRSDSGVSCPMESEKSRGSERQERDKGTGRKDGRS